MRARKSQEDSEETTEFSTVSDNTATRTVVVSHPNGLCMRGASAICQFADVFEAKIDLVKGEHRASATEALEILLLAAECGSQIELEATGPDAEEALDALAELFAENFGLKV